MPKVSVDLRFKGGPGSGHRGHRGRPGVRGGSLPGVGGMSPQQKLERTLDTNNIEISPADKDHMEGAFESDLVDIEGDDRGILKPRPGANVWGLGDTEKAPEREVLAYEVAKSMGYDDFVPATVMREDRDASLQAWVEDSATVFHGGWPGVDEEDVRRMAILDTVIGNKDRHQGNVIVSEVGVMHAIDHGLAFSTSVGAPGYDFARSRATKDWLDTVGGGKFSMGTRLTGFEQASVQNFLNDTNLFSSIASQLGIMEAEAARDRALWLLDNGLDMEFRGRWMGT